MNTRCGYARTIYSNVRAALSAVVDDGHHPATRVRLGPPGRRPSTTTASCPGRPSGHVWCTSLNEEAWKPALAEACVIPVPERGRPYAESRENGMHALRHFYASVLLDAGENIKASLRTWTTRIRA